MEFGFNWAGAIYLILLFAPNILWARNQPEGYAELSAKENGILLAFERVGQVAATVTAVIFVCPAGYSFPWIGWLIAAAIVMVSYECAWVRYFKNGHKLDDMYERLAFIPIPLALPPVIALLLLGIWQQSLITIAAAIVLGIGHLGIHIGHIKDLKSKL